MISGNKTGKVIEIFSSIQGEGLFCGQRQTFLRLQGCNLSCSYCDTPNSAGNSNSTEMTSKQTALECTKFGVQDISITGGEPLLQADFLIEMIDFAHTESDCTNSVRNPRFHLETNGTLSEPMQKIKDRIDVVAMDIKLPSATGLAPMWDKHAGFLGECMGKLVFVKLVVKNESPMEEIRTAARLVAEYGRDIPIILQPVTDGGRPDGVRLMELQDEALKYVSDVRVIPQCHKILGVR